MAVTIYEETMATAEWDWLHSVGSVTPEIDIGNLCPYPSVRGTQGSLYINKVWDTVAGGWVRWQTEFEDVGGVFYPGPGAFGANTSQYRVEAINFSEFTG